MGTTLFLRVMFASLVQILLGSTADCGYNTISVQDSDKTNMMCNRSINVKIEYQMIILCIVSRIPHKSSRRFSTYICGYCGSRSSSNQRYYRCCFLPTTNTLHLRIASLPYLTNRRFWQNTYCLQTQHFHSHQKLPYEGQESVHIMQKKSAKIIFLKEYPSQY